MEVWRAAKVLVASGLVVGGALGLVGCNDSDPIATQTPSPTPAVSRSPISIPSPSSTVKPSASAGALSDEELLELLPAGAERSDLQGAVVTAEFFIQEFSPMFASGDTTVWDSLSGSECTYCDSSRTNALKYLEANWSIRGGELIGGPGITEANLLDDGTVAVRYPATEAPILVTEPGGEERVAIEGGASNYYILMQRAGKVWKVVEVNVEDL